MSFICKITDKDLGNEQKKFVAKKTRIGARGIVIRSDGKIAIFNKTKKNEYKLPGGGVEENENIEEAFKREVLEETGCKIEIIKYLGETEEYKAEIGFKQISHVYVGKVIEDIGKLNLTEREQQEGGELVWLNPNEALKQIKECYEKLIAEDYESVYHTKFVVLRDRKILEYYLNRKRDDSFSPLLEDCDIVR